MHKSYNHIHLETQIAAIRHKVWIPKLRSSLKSINHHCNFCSFMRSLPHPQMMSDLPVFRTNPEQLPFEYVGLDCLGPITVKWFNREKKIWILIFTCTLTRYIHLAILESLETIKVLKAIVSFWTAYGPVKEFISDNGTNFIGAARFIEKEQAKLQQEIDRMSAKAPTISQLKMITWKTIPAHAPWHGGFYERLIKEVKRALSAALSDSKITRDELEIALADAAHRINNRPLTHNSLSGVDEPILTPHLLAKGRQGFPYAPGFPDLHMRNDIKDKSILKKGRKIAEEITRKFITFYLPVLTKRVKWLKDEEPLKIGDLVLLIEPNETRKQWRRAEVVKLHKGRDGRSRVADVRLSDGSIKKNRSCMRIAKLKLHKH